LITRVATLANNLQYLLSSQNIRTLWLEHFLSIQIAILKVLASHASGRATVASLNRDIAILTGSGAEWNKRIKRLASRVPILDIFGNGYVLRDDDGWQITDAGRDFLSELEAVTQDNLPSGKTRAEMSSGDQPGTGKLLRMPIGMSNADRGRFLHHRARSIA
jgi:hypothetical protein